MRDSGHTQLLRKENDALVATQVAEYEMARQAYTTIIHTLIEAQ